MPNPFAANLEALRRRFGTAPSLPDSPSAARPTDDDALRMPAIGIDASWLEQVLPTPLPEVICAVGLSRDLSLDALVHRLTSDDDSGAAPVTRLVLLEPNPDDARRVLARRPWTTLIEAGRLALLVGPDYAGLSHVARLMPGIGTAPVVVHPILASRADLVGHAREVLAKLAFNHDANASARRALASRYLIHTLGNAPAIARESDAGRLRHAFAGRPAVIAAAGPSLDRNVRDLAPVVDRAVLIACDTAAWPLMSVNLTPHMVVAVDASEANARHLSGLPSGRSWLVTEGSIHPTALRPFAGRTFFFKVSNHEPWPWLASMGLDRATLDAWGSVATTAFALALEMGCDPIVFVGGDFAFTGGRPYCRGTSLEATWASWVGGGQSYDEVWDYQVNRWPVTRAPGLDGTPVRTAPHLIAFRDWIAERAAACTDREIVNATGAGILSGAAIRQRSASDTLYPRPALDQAALHAVLRAAHASGIVPSAVSPVLASSTSVVAGAEAALVECWRTFTDGLVSAEAIRTALATPEQQAWALGASAYRRLMEAS